MTAELTIRWQSFHVTVHGRERTVARLEWAARPPVIRAAGPLLVRALPFPGTAIQGAFVVAGDEGAVCPPLAGDRYLIPPPASESPFYLLLGENEQGRLGLEVHVTPTGNDGAEMLTAVVELGDAWPNAPQDLTSEVATLRRLAGTGGHRAERRGYRRLAMDVLARNEHNEIEALRIDLRQPEVVEAMDADLRPMCCSAEIMGIAMLADAGQVAEVKRLVKDLPRSVRTDPDVAALIDVARAADPLPHQEQLIGAVRAARQAGDLEEALRLVTQIGPGSPLFAEAHALHLETAADLLEGALQRGDVRVARELYRKKGKLFEDEVGPDDPWLRSIRAAAGLERPGPSNPDVPYADDIEVAELSDDDLEAMPSSLWQKMRTWFRYKT